MTDFDNIFSLEGKGGADSIIRKFGIPAELFIDIEDYDPANDITEITSIKYLVTSTPELSLKVADDTIEYVDRADCRTFISTDVRSDKLGEPLLNFDDIKEQTFVINDSQYIIVGYRDIKSGMYTAAIELYLQRT
jgi:hypothetical protein